MDEPDLSDKLFERFRKLIYENSGISLGEQKKTLVRTRFAKVMRSLGLQTYQEYFDHVVADETGREMVNMINAISTNLTSFFREQQHFDYLSRVHLPAILGEKRDRGKRRLRAWSAGCSTGEEPYTIAIVLLEALQDPLGWDARILATDISSSVLERAAVGVYKKKSIEPVPPMLRQKYLLREGSRQDPVFRVAPALQALIRFRYLNLMQYPWPFKGQFDIIFCRNVMIYFNRETQERLVNHFCEVLAPGGLLFIGHSESLTGLDHGFRYIQPTIYQK